MQRIQNINADTLLVVNIADAKADFSFTHDVIATNTLFREISDSVNIHFVHREKDFVDFNLQKLLPHKLSEFDPALAAGDIDNNGLDDMIIGGSVGYSAQVFLQQVNGTFYPKR